MAVPGILRLLRLVLHLLRGLLTCAFVFPFADAPARGRHVQRWSRTLLRICRVELRSTQSAFASHALIVANHISWLDIFVVNALQPSRFVAKSEIRDWPLSGWLCEQAGTIFIARGRLRDVRRIYQGLVERLQAGEPVAFFPEGGTSEQGSLRPFHANLFEAAIEAQVPVQPCALQYLQPDGHLHMAVNYVDPITFLQSLWMIVTAESTIVAELAILKPIPVAPHAHRRELADAARSAIAAALPLCGHAQIAPGA